MSDRNIKYFWLKNWNNAKDKVRSFLQNNDTENAILWGNVALSIEIDFFNQFNQKLNEFIAECI